MPHSFPSLAAYLSYWLSSVVAPSTRATTLRAYSEIARRFLVPQLGDLPLRRLTGPRVAHAADVWRAAGASNRRVRTALEVLRTALRAAVHRGLLAVDPTATLPLPKYSARPPRWLSPVEARRLLAAVRGHRYEVAVVLGVYAGLRRGEVGALRWRDLDLRGATLWVRATLYAVQGPLTLQPVKTAASERAVPLPSALVELLCDAKRRARQERRRLGRPFASTDHVFSPGHGGPQWSCVLNAWLSKVLREEALPHVRFQDLRHTAACLLLEAGAEPRTVMELLGHRRVAHTLLLYSHVRDEQKRAAMTRAARLLRPRSSRRRA